MPKIKVLACQKNEDGTFSLHCALLGEQNGDLEGKSILFFTKQSKSFQKEQVLNIERVEFEVRESKKNPGRKYRVLVA